MRLHRALLPRVLCGALREEQLATTGEEPLLPAPQGLLWIWQRCCKLVRDYLDFRSNLGRAADYLLVL